jgi:hypothetical protein
MPPVQRLWHQVRPFPYPNHLREEKPFPNRHYHAIKMIHTWWNLKCHWVEYGGTALWSNGKKTRRYTVKRGDIIARWKPEGIDQRLGFFEEAQSKAFDQ